MIAKNFAACAISLLCENGIILFLKIFYIFLKEIAQQKLMNDNKKFLEKILDFLIYIDNLEAQSHLAYCLTKMRKYFGNIYNFF